MGSDRGSYIVATLGRVTVVPSTPITATLNVTLPIQIRNNDTVNLFRLNNSGNLDGKAFVAKINGQAVNSHFSTRGTFWQDGAGCVLLQNSISTNNDISIDCFQGEVTIESFEFDLEGQNVPFV